MCRAVHTSFVSCTTFLAGIYTASCWYRQPLSCPILLTIDAPEPACCMHVQAQQEQWIDFSVLELDRPLMIWMYPLVYNKQVAMHA